MELMVHPGIGDISWLLSKLSTVGEDFDLLIAEDLKTRRSLPLKDMVPFIRSAGYGGQEFYYVLSQCGNSLFSEYREAEAKGKRLFMTVNNWLEKGNRIEGFLPDLDTDYHYPISGSKEEVDFAEETVSRHPAIGIYTSSFGGIHNWRAWSPFEWLEFMTYVKKEIPEATFYLIGAEWDLDIRDEICRGMQHYKLDYVDLYGRTTLGEALEIIRRLDYFAGFASGLTILADVVNTPTLMLYPNYLRPMMDAWPDPMSLATGTHKGLVWDRPISIFSATKHLVKKALA